MMMRRQHKEQGAVSIFVVIFTALAIIILTIGFVRVMMQDQQQASNADLSQSAYDAALAGVEDAKRALLSYTQTCASGDAERCAEIKARLDSGACDTIDGLVAGVRFADTAHGRENILQTNTTGTGTSFDQAYTCISVSLDTADYLGQLGEGKTHVIPLRTNTPGETFDHVKIEWFTSADSGSTAIDLAAVGGTPTLPTKASWPTNRPAVARAQLIQFAGSSFSVDDFNRKADSNSRTLFLYPSRTGSDRAAFTSDSRTGSDSSGSPVVTLCSETVSGEQYSCSATISLPNPVSGDAANRIAYLRLGALYNGMNYRVSMYSGASSTTPVSFYAVQPSVDSTGRANTQFRRVEARIDLGATNEFPYPEAAVDTTGSLCKDFMVTDNVADYRGSSSCTP